MRSLATKVVAVVKHIIFGINMLDGLVDVAPGWGEPRTLVCIMLCILMCVFYVFGSSLFLIKMMSITRYAWMIS